MLSLMRQILTILCVTLFTSMAFASQEPPVIGMGECPSACVSAMDAQDDRGDDSQPHLCSQACHMTMALPAVITLNAEPRLVEGVPLIARLPVGNTVGPALLPPIA